MNFSSRKLYLKRIDVNLLNLWQSMRHKFGFPQSLSQSFEKRKMKSIESVRSKVMIIRSNNSLKKAFFYTLSIQNLM